MSDPVPAITESAATGEIAEIFADIRQVYRVGVVNLIWRHLATFPQALPWVWQSVRPLYVEGTIEREAGGLRGRIGAKRDDAILASMYRHLAHWPAYLALAWTMLAPLAAGARLDGLIAHAIAPARASARG